jgi:hypothetical protein
MSLCFVSVHGPRDIYFVDEPRIKPHYIALNFSHLHCEAVARCKERKIPCRLWVHS